MTDWKLEGAKLAVGILTPLSVAIVGFVLNAHMKAVEESHWLNQRLVERRLALYDNLAGDLNDLFCFFVWIGNWKDISPADAIAKKRSLDKLVNVNRFLLNDEICNAYQQLVQELFDTYAGAGKDAQLRVDIAGPNGDRRLNGKYAWDPNWEALFSPAGQRADPMRVRAAYQRVMEAFRRSLGPA